METTSGKRLQQEEKQAALRRQIAQLQAQLTQSETQDPDHGKRKRFPTSPKRKRPEQNILAPKSPSPKRRRIDNSNSNTHGPAKLLPSLQSQLYKSSSKKPAAHAPKPETSTVFSKLANVTKTRSEDRQVAVSRSSAFSEKAASVPVAQDDEDDRHGAPKRDERLALVEDLELGAAHHEAPFDDPLFDQLEPNSGIRLSSRATPHDDFQDYLRGRYYLSPSKLYSVIRLQSNKQGYDVPVEGDWVTIAVVAERGPMKYTRAPVGVGREDHEQLPEKEDTLDDLKLDEVGNKSNVTDLRRWKGKSKQNPPPKPGGKKYINLKLIDFGCRSGSTSATGSKSVIRGDAFLSLLLFESDRAEEVTGDDGKKRKLYYGGSKGAFEKMSSLKEGAVVALLNPKVLKPFQRSGDAPHPTDNILALTPDSMDSTLVIGHSRDLGMCKAVKRDGKVCGSWCDKRVSDACDYHIQNAVQTKRAARPEFSIGTGGMSANAKKHKPAYDPSRQWGLKPDPNVQTEGATYVVSGHIVSGSNNNKNLFVGESVGRDAQARAARKAASKDADRTLEELLRKDKEGMKILAAAREFGKKPIRGKGKDGKKKGKEGRRGDEGAEESSSDEDEQTSSKSGGYSAELIRCLGFDPAGREPRKSADPNVLKKLEALASAQSSRRSINLGPRPGKKASNVVIPTTATTQSHFALGSSETSPTSSLNNSDHELEYGETVAKMVDLDSSDTEL